MVTNVDEDGNGDTVVTLQPQGDQVAIMATLDGPGRCD